MGKLDICAGIVRVKPLEETLEIDPLATKLDEDSREAAVVGKEEVTVKAVTEEEVTGGINEVREITRCKEHGFLRPTLVNLEAPTQGVITRTI